MLKVEMFEVEELTVEELKVLESHVNIKGTWGVLLNDGKSN